ncbi:hypothetical protein B0H11DRAFT_1914976 [Mycena galericulata]|nr:hypothetical protein B0H11DRAFT_1914976 [Mycena galericulata]
MAKSRIAALTDLVPEATNAFENRNSSPSTSIRSSNRQTQGVPSVRTNLYNLTDILPFELLNKIFWHFLASGSPLVLCWVCHRWRAIAMTAVNLWIQPSFVLGRTFFPKHPDDDYHMNLKARQFIDQMSQWLHRARSSRTVCLSVTRTNREDYRWREEPVLEAIVPPFSSCFRSLSLDTTQSQWFSLIEGRPSFPNLASLSLHLPALDLDHWPPCNEDDLYASAPLLRNLTLGAGRVFGGHTRISHVSGFCANFPWSQLTHLDMDGTALKVGLWRKILRRCTSLCVGSFTLEYQTSRVDNYPRDVIFPYLVTLQINVRHPLRISNLFHNMVFPSIESLRIFRDHDSGTFARNGLTSFIQHFAGLRRLTLRVRITNHTLLRILRALPELEKLSLYDVDFDPVSRALDMGCIPKLKVLAISRTPPRPHTSLHIFDGHIKGLANTAQTWASISRKGWEFRVFSTGEILSGFKSELLAADNTLEAFSVVTPPARRQAKRGRFYAFTTNHTDFIVKGLLHVQTSSIRKLYAVMCNVLVVLAPAPAPVVRTDTSDAMLVVGLRTLAAPVLLTTLDTELYHDRAVAVRNSATLLLALVLAPDARRPAGPACASRLRPQPAYRAHRRGGRGGSQARRVPARSRPCTHARRRGGERPRGRRG